MTSRINVQPACGGLFLSFPRAGTGCEIEISHIPGLKQRKSRSGVSYFVLLSRLFSLSLFVFLFGFQRLWAYFALLSRFLYLSLSLPFKTLPIFCFALKIYFFNSLAFLF